MEPEILYEDASLLVVYKPAGMAVESADPSQMDLYSFLRNLRKEKEEEDYIAVINRLDQPVEGIVAIGKSKAAAEKLSKQMIEHDIRKSYYTIITRDNLPEKGTMVDYLVKDGRKSRAMVVDKNDPRAKKAELNYRVLEGIDNMHLVDVDLLTGRFHQIRCQFARRSAPILGDIKYGGYNTGRNLALCAYRLSLKSPETGEYVTFQVMPKGKDFQEFSYFRNQD
ncbi:MAG: RNA pseudouridine synthase [Lachnospiraceae bacterium]|nr:RNA pseudouridine synthase [Lachnospiraceae bacterium]